jgi:hypothetical protein
MRLARKIIDAEDEKRDVMVLVRCGKWYGEVK